MAALANVASQYALALDAGAVDPAEVLPAFLEALDAAGMQAYLNERMHSWLLTSPSFFQIHQGPEQKHLLRPLNVEKTKVLLLLHANKGGLLVS